MVRRQDEEPGGPHASSETVAIPGRCSARGKEEHVVPLFACRSDGVDKGGVKEEQLMSLFACRID